MQARRRNIAVFSMSALDLFAAALAAFIMIVLVLFPYYNRGGTDISMEALEALVQKRREAAATTQTDMAAIRALRAEIRLLDKQYKTTQANMSEIEQRILEVQKQTADIDIPKPTPRPVPQPQPVPEPPQSQNQGGEFSILGLATSKKNFVIVVDMSGSMDRHSNKVTQALDEILDQMQPDYKFSIIGYRGGPTYSYFPAGGRPALADAAMMQGARRFVSNLPRKFGGGTPTQSAMMKALLFRPEAIILLSDGEPDDGNISSIVANITKRNRGGAEIHTVAIGDYTKDKNLTLFLQALALQNGGDFVGRAR